MNKPMLTEKHNEGKLDIDADLARLRDKLAIAEESGENADKIKKQIELLEDSIIIYRLTSAKERNV